MTACPTAWIRTVLPCCAAAILGLWLAVPATLAADPRRPDGARAPTLSDPADPSAVRSPTYRSRTRRSALMARERLMPQVSIQLASLSAFRQSTGPGDLGDHALFDDLSDHVLSRVERATRKALKNYLIESTDIERRIDAWRDRRRSESEAAQPDSAERKPDFDVSFHGLTPAVRMRYGLGHGSVKLSLDAEGALGMTYRLERMNRTRFHAGFDGDDTFRLEYRYGF